MQRITAQFHRVEVALVVVALVVRDQNIAVILLVIGASTVVLQVKFIIIMPRQVSHNGNYHMNCANNELQFHLRVN